MITFLPRRLHLDARWRDLAFVLVVSAVICSLLPGLAPLCAFGIVVCLLGEGLVAYFLGVLAGVAAACIYPSVFGAMSYNAGQGPISSVSFIMQQMNATIIGLLFLNAFFELAFKNRYFAEYALPMMRAKLRTARSRLGWGLILALMNFCDDAAAGGVLNRLYEPDIKSPGVSKPIKTKMLVMVLLLANAFPAIIPFSSWTVFYLTVNPKFHLYHTVFILLPVTLAFFCLWMFADSGRSWCKVAGKRAPQSVIPVDFLLDRADRNPGITTSVLCWVLACPFLGVFAVLFPGIYYGIDGTLLFAFATGLVLQIIVSSLLGLFEHRWRSTAQPFTSSAVLAKGEEEVKAVQSALQKEHERLVRGPQELLAPVSCVDRANACVTLKGCSQLANQLRVRMADIPPIKERLYPALKPADPVLFRLSGFWKSDFDSLVERGITEMVSGLLRVFMVLVLAGATSTCLGLSLDGQESKVDVMLANEGVRFKQIADGVCNWKVATWFDSGIFAFALALAGLLWGLRHLRISSAWGILAIVFPLITVILKATSKGSATSELVSACLFGLVLSFGVWCNSTIKTGDNVMIAAKIQNLDPEKLILLSKQMSIWPISFTAVGLAFALLFHPVLEAWPTWVLWGVLPLGWAVVTSIVSYRRVRKGLIDK